MIIFILFINLKISFKLKKFFLIYLSVTLLG